MMAQFDDFIPQKCTVIREGEKKEIEAKLLVPGDVVIVKVGENIPCDIVIFKSSEMKVNNASLTGESEDIFIDPEAPPTKNIFESKNVGFFGTQCTAGEGTESASRLETELLLDKLQTLPHQQRQPRLHYPLRSIDSF